MPVTADLVGRSYPPTKPYVVSAAKIKEFAEAVGSTDPVHTERDVAQGRGYRDVVAQIGRASCRERVSVVV